MRILLVEEHSERERLALLFLQHFLQLRGHQVRLTNIWELEADYVDFAPRVVIDNISDSVGHFAGKWSMLDSSHRNINLIWEQLLNPSNLTRYRFERTVGTSLVDGRIAWGEPFREMLLEENPWMEPSRVRTTGSIKHAVYTFFEGLNAPDLAAVYGIDTDRWDKIVLVAESFAHGAKDEHQYRRLDPNGRVSPFMYEYVRRTDGMREEFETALENLAREMPSVLFVLRMHPGKDEDYYQTYAELGRLPNIALNHDGDVSPLIYVSDLVICSRSGVLIDSYFMNTPAINLTPGANVFDRLGILDTVEEEFGVSIPITQVDPQTLEQIMATPRHSEHETEVADTWFAPVGRECFERTIDFVEEIARRPALEKRIPRRCYGDWYTLKRAAGNKLRQHVLRRTKPLTDDFDYETIFGLLRDNVAEARPAQRATVPRPTVSGS